MIIQRQGGVTAMKRLGWIVGVLSGLIFWGAAAAQGRLEMDTRIYLKSGDVVTGKMVQRSPDMVILKLDNDIFTFEVREIARLETLDSLGDRAERIEVREFPHLGFLGATVAFGAVATFGFNRASDKEEDAAVNRPLLPDRARQLEDQASTARAVAWSATAAVVGSAIFALYPKKVERRVLPEIGLRPGEREVRVACMWSF